MGWQRSEEEYPRVWANFTCEKTRQRFIIKDLSPEYYDIALGYMTNIFLTEPLIIAVCRPLRILEDPVSRLQIQQKWLKIMKSNMAIVCCTDDDQVPRVAAIHFTAVREKGQNRIAKDPSSILNKYEQFTEVVEDLIVAGDCFNRFGADQFLCSHGLFVLPEFRGQGIATHLLRARITMCRELGLPGTANVFSTPGAQAAARSAGYQELAVTMFNGQRQVLMGTAIQ